MKNFKKKKNYKAKCMIMSPYGIIKEGTVFTGEQWKYVLVYGVGNGFDEMFEITEEPSQWDDFAK